MARRRVKLIFSRELVTEPLIWRLGRDHDVVTNIRRADVTGETGWVVLELTGAEEELEKGIAFLESRGVAVEPVEGDIVQ